MNNKKASTEIPEELNIGEISEEMKTDQNPYPNIIDNKHQRLDGVLKELLSKSEYAKIVSGYFYIEGFNLVSKYAQETKVDIVIGVRTTKATKEEFEKYTIKVVPTLFYIGKAGIVSYKEVGFSDGRESQMEARIKELLRTEPNKKLQLE